LDFDLQSRVSSNSTYMSLASLLISSVLQVALVLIICYIVYRLVARKKNHYLDVSFLHFTGLKLPTKTSVLMALKIVFVLGLITISFKYSGLIALFENYQKFESSTASPTAAIKGLGFSFFSVFYSLIYSVIQTGLSEEILFRGVIAKWLIRKLGYRNGNLLQALIFAAIHVLLLMSTQAGSSFALAILFFLMPFILGYIMGYVNEKHGNGSIIPSWIIHGATNLFVALTQL